MLKSSISEVIGTHPMFGPGVKSLKNQAFVLCPARGKKWLPWLKKLLNKHGANIKIAKPEEHDKMMSVIQGIIHFSSISISHALKDLDVNIRETQQYRSPIYMLRMHMVGRILNQDPELYADIELENPQTTKALRAYLRNAKKLLNIIDKKDKAAFLRYFKEAANYLGDFKEEAERESNKIINKK
jgi:prephenate dehydrogenase